MLCFVGVFCCVTVDEEVCWVEDVTWRDREALGEAVDAIANSTSRRWLVRGSYLRIDVLKRDVFKVVMLMVNRVTGPCQVTEADVLAVRRWSSTRSALHVVAQ